jgi:ATP-dependent Clp protease adapter protein ClpS
VRALPIPTDLPKTSLDHPWQVVLFNDEVHSFEEVIHQVQKAVGCPLERAVELTWMAHRNGRAIVLIGGYVECERAADILEQIRLGVRLEKT